MKTTDGSKEKKKQRKQNRMENKNFKEIHKVNFLNVCRVFFFFGPVFLPVSLQKIKTLGTDSQQIAPRIKTLTFPIQRWYVCLMQISFSDFFSPTPSYSNFLRLSLWYTKIFFRVLHTTHTQGINNVFFFGVFLVPIIRYFFKLIFQHQLIPRCTTATTLLSS